MKRVAETLQAHFAPKNNCHVVGVNLKTEHNVENAVAVGKGTDRYLEVVQERKSRLKSVLIPFRSRSNRTAMSMRKMANQENVNPNTIKTTVNINLGLKSFVRTLRHLHAD